MIQIIAGEKGKGKTKILLDKVNEAVATAGGSVVYLDKSNKHMYELNNKIRLINVKDYLIENYNEFLGFICGIASQDHDLEYVYLDSFLKIACINETDLEAVLSKLKKISDAFDLNFVISVSLNKQQIPQEWQESVIVSL